MGVTVKYVGSLLESEILTLTSASNLWYPNGFYYPADVPVLSYFYRLENGVMNPKGKGDSSVAIGGAGVTINGNVIGGVKTKILATDVLNIPKNYDYNTFKLNVDGVINVDGQINII